MAGPPFRYCAFGIALQSALELPELQPDPAPALADVTVEHGPAAQPPGLTALAPHVAAGPGVFWMAVPGTGQLLVLGGKRIIADPAPGRAADLRAYLLGSALGALLLQRGTLPLHASAVAMGGRAIAFTGVSGAGKSTLALALRERGHDVLCDDICAVDWTGEEPIAWPGLVNLKLWRATLTAGGHDADGLSPVLTTLDKYLLPVALAPSPLPLGAVLVLDRGETAALERLTGAAAAQALVANTFRGSMVPALGTSAAHFAACLQVARRAGVWRLTRPWALDRLGEAVAVLQERFGGAP